MAEPNKPGNGSLFRNNRKTADNHPDFNGRITDPEGKEWQLSAWVRTSASGLSYMSLQMKEPYVKPAEAPEVVDAFLTTTTPAAPYEPETVTYDSSEAKSNDLPF